MDIAVLADHWVKIKESKKWDKYLELARELKISNIKVTMIPIVFGAHGIIPTGFVKGLEVLEIRQQERPSTLLPY